MFCSLPRNSHAWRMIGAGPDYTLEPGQAWILENKFLPMGLSFQQLRRFRRPLIALLCMVPLMGSAADDAAHQKLVSEAEAALKFAPVAVTQKTKPAPSGDPHDYASTAPFFWPDPTKPDGLPYIRRDGEVNPESRTVASDFPRAQALGNAIETLARAYAATGREEYAAHAARLLRTWFLDPATFMRPHLDFAQGVPGVNVGRQFGIIEGNSLVSALEHADLLEGSEAWTPADHRALMQWASQFLDWYLTSPFGVAEAATRNNHGTHYDVQVMRMAFMVGRVDIAKRVAEEARERRIAAQIEPDGRQTHELARTNSLSYSRMNLAGLMRLANLAGRVGVDLWHFETADGRSIRRALDFLVPYLRDPSREWPHQQIRAMSRRDFVPMLRQAAEVYNESEYEIIADRLARVP